MLNTFPTSNLRRFHYDRDLAGRFDRSRGLMFDSGASAFTFTVPSSKTLTFSDVPLGEVQVWAPDRVVTAPEDEGEQY